MVQLTTCPAPDEDLAPRYVAGVLPAREVEAFELHLLGCASCRQAVREAAAIRGVLRSQVARRRWLAWTVPLAATAGVLLWATSSRGDPIQRLGAVDPAPPFAGLSVRADPDSTAALARQGLQAYGRKDYRRAARLLGRAAAADPSPATSYWHGLALLLTGDPSGAAPALAAATIPSDGPYAPDAHFFAAKAWLQLGRTDSALAHLAAVPPGAGTRGVHAAALADSIRRARR